LHQERGAGTNRALKAKCELCDIDEITWQMLYFDLLTCTRNWIEEVIAGVPM